jgi:hypothetical protein
MAGEIMSLEGLGALLNPRRKGKRRGGSKRRKNPSHGGWEYGRYQRRNRGRKARRNPGRFGGGGGGGSGLMGALKSLGVGVAAGLAAEGVNALIAKASARYPGVPAPLGSTTGHLVAAGGGLAAWYAAKKFMPKYAAIIPIAFGAALGSRMVAQNAIPQVTAFVQGAYSEALVAQGGGGGGGTAGVDGLVAYPEGLGQGEDSEQFI